MHVTQTDIKQAPILVVDDSTASLQKMKRTLDDAGFEDITTTTEPGSVIPYYQETQYSLIILDYHMPEQTGEDVLDSLNANFPQRMVNVLFWTSADDEALSTRVLDKGAKDILRKGNIAAQEIVARVQNSVESFLYYKKTHDMKKQLDKKVQRRTRQLRQSSLETIGRLARAAEFRDNETGAHIHRIGLLASELTKRLGLDDTICDGIRYAAPMHDVGKLSIPDDILLKPDSLNDDEWKTMKKHTVYGSKLLSGSKRKYIKLAQKIARHHHEHWDGSGYPDGLEKSEIPVEARIVAVCDVFDAVLSDRPYKEAWTTDRALSLIREQKGSQFDPEIATCFLAHADTMIEIRNGVEDEVEKERSYLTQKAYQKTTEGEHMKRQTSNKTTR